ncbi:MAG: acetyl-CoA carboxylase biotin carboxyl carrier protein subunit [Bacteroidales bacterium]|nr:acetyl-CoA carboxylase biotin carboxyl carrier protein subunit [Bacteroidales bacterium]
MKSYKFKINDKPYEVNINEVEGQEMKLEVNGQEYVVTVDRELKHTQKAVPSPRPTATNQASTAQTQSSNAGSSQGGQKVTSPLPGTILDVFVNVGDTVKEGQTVVLLEAMKMENNIDAECSGVVKEVKARKGDSVMEGDVLVVIE